MISIQQLKLRTCAVHAVFRFVRTAFRTGDWLRLLFNKRLGGVLSSAAQPRMHVQQQEHRP